MAETKQVNVLLTGRVQGVWFRESTRQEAERLGVNGWIRNLDDGGVEGVFEGDPSAVDALVRWCHRGPDEALVRDTQIVERTATGKYDGFQVVR